MTFERAKITEVAQGVYLIDDAGASTCSYIPAHKICPPSMTI